MKQRFLLRLLKNLADNIKFQQVFRAHWVLGPGEHGTWIWHKMRLHFWNNELTDKGNVIEVEYVDGT